MLSVRIISEPSSWLVLEGNSLRQQEPLTPQVCYDIKGQEIVHPSLLQTLVTRLHHWSIKCLLSKVVLTSCGMGHFKRLYLMNKVCIIKKHRGPN